MIDDTRHDFAIEYVLGSLVGDAGHEFEAWLESDPELRALVDELREATASLAHGIPWQKPPPHLREKVLALARGESARSAAARPRVAWMPWAIAAGFAIACAILFSERGRWRSTARDAQSRVAQNTDAVIAAQRETNGLAGRLSLAEAQANVHLEQIGEMRDEIVKLRGRDALAQMKIAALTAQAAAFAKAGAIVVWDPQEQRGIIKITNLPKPAPGKDYQLWVIDPTSGEPVSAGVVPVTDEGAARISFKPGQPIESAGQFAISIEQEGGVAKVAGPIVLAGN